MKPKKEILVLTSKIPFPLNDGGSISQYVFTDALRSKHNFTYILLEKNKNDTKAINDLKQKWPNVNILQIKTYETSEINESSDYSTTFTQNIKDFIVKVYRSFRKKNIREIKSIDPKDIIKKQLASPYNFINPVPQQYADAVEIFFEHNHVNLVQVEHLPFMNVIDLIPKSTNTLYVHHELQFERISSIPLSDKENCYKNYVVSLVTGIESAFLSKYRNIITFSDIDSKKLAEILKQQVNIFTNPFPVLENSLKEPMKVIAKSEKIIFQGSDNHHPNLDALDWYCQEIAPILKKRTQHKLYVTGKWSEENQKYLNRNGDFIFTGFIDNIDKFSENSIMIVPVRIGSGIRTKILYAMAQGLPVISTKKGIEGIEVSDGKEAIITDNPKLFAKYILDLLDDSQKSSQIGLNGNQFIRENFSYQKLIEKREEILNQIL